jgi:hypothetical protein
MVVAPPATALVRYDEMCRAIEAAYQVDEVKHIRDKAAAIEVYAKQAHNVEAERQACEIRLRAERRCGQLLREREMAKGAQGNPGGQGAAIVRSHGETAQTLADLGLSKTQSSRFQKLADIPQDQFEAGLAAPRRPTTSGLLAGAEPNPPGGQTECCRGHRALAVGPCAGVRAQESAGARSQ